MDCKLTNEHLEKLRQPFKAERISFKVQTKPNDNGNALVVAYIDARDVMDRLDEVAGGEWYDEYDKAPSGGLECRLTVLGVTRRDVGEDENKTEPEKSGYSDAFKRAAVKFGIGRFLYDLPKMWAKAKVVGNNFYLADGEEERLRQELARHLGQGKTPVEVAKDTIKRAIQEAESPAEVPNPAAEHPYGNFVIAWNQAMKITEKKRPTIQDIYDCGPAGISYLQWILNTPAKDDADEKMKKRVAEVQEAVREFMKDVQSNQTVDKSTGEIVEKAKGLKAAKELQILSRNWNGWIAEVAKEIPYYAENGKPNPAHIINTLKGMGYDKFTDDDADELKAMLRVHAAQAETDQEKIFGTGTTQTSFSS